MAAFSIRTGLRDVSAGAICWILSAAYCLSFAALIFTGPLAPFLATGVAVTFLSAAVGAAIVAWRSSFPFAIGGPDNATSAVVAALVAGLMANLGATGHPLGAALILMALVTVATGLLLSGLGVSHAGRAVRFVPYPVIGGFMGATGVVMILGAVQVIADHRLNLSSIALFASSETAAKLAAGAAVACVLAAALAQCADPARRAGGCDPGDASAAVGQGHSGQRSPGAWLDVPSIASGGAEFTLEIVRIAEFSLGGAAASGG